MTSLHSVGISIKRFLLSVWRENIEDSVDKTKEAFQINLSRYFLTVSTMRGFDILYGPCGAEHGHIVRKQ